MCVHGVAALPSRVDTSPAVAPSHSIPVSSHPSLNKSDSYKVEANENVIKLMGHASPLNLSTVN